MEGETNGLLTYDRELIKLPAEEIAEINSRVTLKKPEPPREPDKETEEETDEAEDQGERES